MSANDGAMMARKPRPAERPGGVLARGAAAEVGARDQDRRALELGAVEREILVLGPVPEQELPVARALDALEELLRDDLVGVDVGAIERRDRSRDDVEVLHQTSSRTSTRQPVTAAAAAISGLIRCVRARRPWRPSKLRLDVEAHALLGPGDVGIHAEAHRASRVAPLEAGVGEDAVEALGLGLRLDPHRARHDERLHAGRHVLAAHDLGGCPQVAQPAVRAGADEDAVDGRSRERRAGLQAHVVQRPLLVLVGGRGHRRGDGRRLAGVGAPGDLRGQRGGVDHELAVERRVRVASCSATSARSPARAAPARRAGPPGSGTSSRRRRSARPARPIRSTCSRPSCGLPSRAPGSPRRRTRRHGCVAPAAVSCAISPRIMSFGPTPIARRARERDAHGVRALLRQRLRGQHVLDLARADAECERAEGAVRRGVRIAADDRHAGLRDAELRADHVDDALAAVPEAVVRDAELLDVARQRVELLAGDLVLDGARELPRGHVVVGRGNRAIRSPDAAPARAAAPRRPAGS